MSIAPLNGRTRALLLPPALLDVIAKAGQAVLPGDGIPSPFFLPGHRVFEPQECAMRNFWWDGFFGESSEVLWFQYFPVFALSVGAGAGLLGTIASLTSLSSALALAPGALLDEKTGRS